MTTQVKNYIGDFDYIVSELNEEIVKFLHTETPDDPEAIVDRGNKLQSYMGRLSTMLADAKYYQDNAFVHYANDSKGMVASTAMSGFIKARCKDENYLVNLLENLLKKCYSENEWNRTLISKAKEEFRVNNSNSNTQK
jgi:hypothetical protein